MQKAVTDISPAVPTIDAGVRAWLDEFEIRNGRRLKVLHVGNIANNAYNNAKVQRAYGVDADVIAVNYYHVMGCPEWEDAEIEGTVENAFLPDFWALNLNGFKRPRWFVQGQIEASRRYLWFVNTGRPLAANVAWSYLQAYRYQLVKPRINRIFKNKAVALSIKYSVALIGWMLARRNIKELESQTHTAKAKPAGLSPAQFCAKHNISREDYNYFWGAAQEWLPLFRRYDVIQAYSTDPIWPFLCQLPNFVAYEHGTIREIPFQDTNIGRMTYAAYRASPAVFITNVDNIRAADRLELKPEQRCYLPHAFDYRKLLTYAASRSPVSADPSKPPQIFMPSRQDWVVQDPNWAKGNDLVIRATKILRDRGLEFTVKFIEWGKDVEASHKLVYELGVEDRVVWSGLLTKRALWDEYLRSAAVIDQFLLPGISGVSFEAMTLGRPVITCDQPGLNETFFGKAPPLLTANTAEEIAERLQRVITDPEWREQQGRDSARWIAEYHSTERIFEIQVNAFRKVLERQQ